MQRRHYEAIAEILKDAKSKISNQTEYVDLCGHFVTKLKERNSNFKPDIFVAYIFGDE